MSVINYNSYQHPGLHPRYSEGQDHRLFLPLEELTDTELDDDAPDIIYSNASNSTDYRSYRAPSASSMTNGFRGEMPVAPGATMLQDSPEYRSRFARAMGSYDADVTVQPDTYLGGGSGAPSDSTLPPLHCSSAGGPARSTKSQSSLVSKENPNLISQAHRGSGYTLSYQKVSGSDHLTDPILVTPPSSSGLPTRMFLAVPYPMQPMKLILAYRLQGVPLPAECSLSRDILTMTFTDDRLPVRFYVAWDQYDILLPFILSVASWPASALHWSETTPLSLAYTLGDPSTITPTSPTTSSVLAEAARAPRQSIASYRPMPTHRHRTQVTRTPTQSYTNGDSVFDTTTAETNRSRAARLSIAKQARIKANTRAKVAAKVEEWICPRENCPRQGQSFSCEIDRNRHMDHTASCEGAEPKVRFPCRVTGCIQNRDGYCRKDAENRHFISKHTAEPTVELE